jgi:hypothetical protein
MVEKKEVCISYIPIDHQPANILTKALGQTKFENFLKLLNNLEQVKL